jgi:hypothetical protein
MDLPLIGNVDTRKNQRFPSFSMMMSGGLDPEKAGHPLRAREETANAWGHLFHRGLQVLGRIWNTDVNLTEHSTAVLATPSRGFSAWTSEARQSAVSQMAEFGESLWRQNPRGQGQRQCQKSCDDCADRTWAVFNRRAARRYGATMEVRSFPLHFSGDALARLRHALPTRQAAPWQALAGFLLCAVVTLYLNCMGFRPEFAGAISDAISSEAYRRRRLTRRKRIFRAGFASNPRVS